MFLTVWFRYKLSNIAVYVRLKFCTLGSGGLIQPGWFLVRYNSVQGYDLPVGHPDT
jgi:hypothetical protein